MDHSPSLRYDSVLVVSDTHIGLPDSQIFRKDFEEFVRYLSQATLIDVDSEEGDFQFELPRAIILLGDFLDLWDGQLSRLPAFSADFGRALTVLCDVLYLRGNHDYIIPDIHPTLKGPHEFEICEDKFIEVGGRKFLFIHGHQFMSAFGPLSVKIESFINPFYTMVENFFSRLTKGRGREVLEFLTVLAIILGLINWLGQPILTRLSPVAKLSVWILFGLLLPIADVSGWRVGQKTLYKMFTLIFGDLINSLRGATRGDTIEYLTSPSRPIFRWFQRDSKQSEEAKEAGFVIFGHTHIPEGPLPGNSPILHNVMFLNTGSWVRPPSQRSKDLSERLREFTRPVDRFDEWILLLLVGLNLVAYFTLRALPTPVLIADVFFLSFEVMVAVGKSSYRRLPQAGSRSLAFIGRDVSGTFRTTLLYWNPATKRLSTRPYVAKAVRAGRLSSLLAGLVVSSRLTVLAWIRIRPWNGRFV